MDCLPKFDNFLSADEQLVYQVRHSSEVPTRVILFAAILLLLPFTPASAFEVTTGAFAEGGEILKVHACSRKGGKDLSIPVKFTNIPSGTAALAIIIDDPDAEPVAGHTWVH